MSVNQEFEKTGSIAYLCDEYLKNNFIDPEASERLGVKRGLRNPDGTGVLAGLTNVCDVVGYDLVDGKRVPTDGRLIYRGIDVEQIVRAAYAEDRFVFEEVIWLLLFGSLPTPHQLASFKQVLEAHRELPKDFAEDMIMKAPSPNIMNKMARSVLALYSYDDNPEEQSLTNILSQSIALIASLPTIMVTFACRVLSSSGTDTYSAISAAIGSLKGPKHGGANHKVMEMLGYIMEGVKDHSDDAEIAAFLRRILRKEAGDGSGLIYGMGHAVYTKSDPRAVILRRNAEHLAVEKGFEDEFRVLCAVERLGPDAVREVKGTKDVCANVDLFSGLIYRMLGISEDLFTPLFAISRIPGWCAHRVEEVVFANRIMRPAYKYLGHEQEYIPLEERG